MGKGRLGDFIRASFEDLNQVFIESDFCKETAIKLSENIVEEGTALAIGATFSAIAPRLNSIRLTYKEKRFERHIEKALAILDAKIDEFDKKYNALSEELQERFRGLYVEWILDNLNMEKQIEKVQYHVCGYINMMENDTTDDIMLIFLETLNQLTVLDIDVLKMYSRDYEENWKSVCEKRGISYEQMDMIKAKLERHGLLYSNNDNQRDENLDFVVDYLEERIKEENRKNGNPSKIKLGKTKKVKRSESYSITRLGRDFLMRIG